MLKLKAYSFCESKPEIIGELMDRVEGEGLILLIILIHSCRLLLHFASYFDSNSLFDITLIRVLPLLSFHDLFVLRNEGLDFRYLGFKVLVVSVRSDFLLNSKRKFCVHKRVF